jgi:hypothetical protein
MVLVPGEGALNVQLDAEVQALFTIPFMPHIAVTAPVVRVDVLVDETVKGVPVLTT